MMLTASEASMTKRIRLSSDLVPFYRMLGVFGGGLGSAIGVFVFWLTSDWRDGIYFLGFAAVFAIAGFSAWSIKEILYDEKYLYVDSLFKTTKYEMKKVHRLNGCYGSADRTFEIEFFPERGSILKINYVPPGAERFHYIWKDEFSGRALRFKERLRELQVKAS